MQRQNPEAPACRYIQILTYGYVAFGFAASVYAEYQYCASGGTGRLCSIIPQLLVDLEEHLGMPLSQVAIINAAGVAGFYTLAKLFPNNENNDEPQARPR